jgi:hypothetical protein
MPFAALAAGAVSAMLAASPAFSLTAQPAHLAAQPGQRAVFRVYDGGTLPATVTTGLMVVAKAGKSCTVRAGVPAGYAITPRTLHVASHHWARAVVRIPKATSAQDLAVIFSAADGHRGNVQVRGAVASQLVVSGQRACVSAVLPKRDPAGGFPVGWSAAGGGLLALIAASTAVVVSRRRRRGALSAALGPAYERGPDGHREGVYRR